MVERDTTTHPDFGVSGKPTWRWTPLPARHNGYPVYYREATGDVVYECDWTYPVDVPQEYRAAILSECGLPA